MKPRLIKIISLVSGILVACVLAEIVLRIYKFNKYSTNTLQIAQEPAIVYEHKPSITFVNRHGIKIKYNSLGFIGNEVEPKKTAVFRILGIGDSIMAGEYLEEKERYVNKIGMILSKRLKRDVEIINAAVAGYNTWQELALLSNKGLKVEPDLIIVGVCLNDDSGWRPEFKKAWGGKLQEVPRHHKKARHLNFLYQRSCLYEFLYDCLYRIKKISKKGVHYFNEYDRYEVEGYVPDLTMWKKPLQDMITLARKNKIEILFVIFPFEQQVLRREQISFKPLVDFFEQEDVYFIDLIKYLNNESKESLFIKQDPVHLNILGSKIVSQAIADYILDHNILTQIFDKSH